ncbi:MAG: DUF58 domain-containing protein [Streptosporangiales bacterium]|nr:DUF58 domain-containing protein [Streptosporangiales bacterium]
MRLRRRTGKVAELAPENMLRRLELKVVRRLEGLLHGDHLGLLPGPGSELAEARVYLPGEDDVRHMDWAVTARTTIPHVRDLVADRELETWALVDLSASMDFGTARMEKRDLAVAALAAIGFLTARIGDRFGAYILEHGTTRRWPARSGRAALYGLLHSLANVPRTPAEAPDPILAGAVSSLSRSQPKRGLRVIVSDFLDLELDPGAVRDWERPMRQLATRHQVLAVEIVDPRELELPDVGLVTVVDPETGEAQDVYPTKRVRERYAAAARAQREGTRRALRRCGAQHLVLRTDRDWVDDIARWVLQQRRVAHRLGRPVGGVSA